MSNLEIMNNFWVEVEMTYYIDLNMLMSMIDRESIYKCFGWNAPTKFPEIVNFANRCFVIWQGFSTKEDAMKAVKWFKENFTNVHAPYHKTVWSSREYNYIRLNEDIDAHHLAEHGYWE